MELGGNAMCRLEPAQTQPIELNGNANCINNVLLVFVIWIGPAHAQPIELSGSASSICMILSC